jgi:hypothetical protein
MIILRTFHSEGFVIEYTLVANGTDESRFLSNTVENGLPAEVDRRRATTREPHGVASHSASRVITGIVLVIPGVALTGSGSGSHSGLHSGARPWFGTSTWRTGGSN